MKTDSELWQAQIRQAMRESIGWGRDVSVKEASEITGIGTAVIYKIASGELVYPDKYLTDLLDIPSFADRLMAIRGHACSFVGNEEGCYLQAIAAAMEATGEAGPIVASGKITNAQKHKLAERFHGAVRKVQAWLHRHKLERMAQRAGAR